MADDCLGDCEEEMSQTIEVTDQVEFSNNDDENLPLTKCVCGQKFPAWTKSISIYQDNPWQCPHCGAKLFFAVSIRVFQVIP